jgi:hypothetical protein
LYAQAAREERRERKEEDDSLEVEGVRLAEVEQFCYLGDLLDCEAGLERTVRARVTAAWLSWRKVSSLLVNGGILVKNRSGVYVACIRSVMLYGAESWPLTARLENILRCCYRRMLSYMAGVRWEDSVSSGEMARRCGVEELEVELRRRRQMVWTRCKGGGGECVEIG